MSNRLNPNIGPTASPGRFAERVCCAGRLQAIGNDGAGQAESKSQCSHRPLLLRSLPVAVLAAGYRPQWHPSGAGKAAHGRKLREFWFPNISGRENCASFAFPIYRDGKTARVLPSRYIGTGKLREFCFPDISGRENCASFAFPIYRDEKTARVLLSRYIGTGKLREFWRPDISALQKLSPRSFGDSA